MRTYTATSLLTLPSGAVVRLSEKQAADRLPRLEKLRAPGTYRLKEPLHFKAKETFGYEGDLPKSLASQVEERPEGAKKGAKKDGE